MSRTIAGKMQCDRRWRVAGHVWRCCTEIAAPTKAPEGAVPEGLRTENYDYEGWFCRQSNQDAREYYDLCPTCLQREATELRRLMGPENMARIERAMERNKP